MKAKIAFKTPKGYYPVTFVQFAEGRPEEITMAIENKHRYHLEEKKKADEARLRALESMRKMGINISSKKAG